MRQHKLLIALIAFGLTWAEIVGAEDKPIEEQVVDALTKVFGVHPGFRVNHAKGIVVEGSFKASPEAAVLSRPYCSMAALSRDRAIFRCDRNSDYFGRLRRRQSARHGHQVPSARR